MQTNIFDGRAWAKTEQEILRDKVRELRDSFNITPSFVTVLVGDDKASKLYTSLKQKVAQNLGIKFTARVFDNSSSLSSIKKFIEKQNEDQSVHGIMVQLPLPDKLSGSKDQIIRTIDKEKDVDGLRDDSNFTHPTVKAILEILEITVADKNKDKIVVVGDRGMVGSKLVLELEAQNYNFEGIDKDVDNVSDFTKTADVLVSATGQPSLIKGYMVKEGVVIIDVGAPKPDVQRVSVEGRAKFLTPVPGGIGPMTISMLMQNVIDSARDSFEIPA